MQHIIGYSQKKGLQTRFTKSIAVVGMLCELCKKALLRLK